MMSQTFQRTASPSFLRRVLQANGLFSALSGATLVAAAKPLASLFGLASPPIFIIVGALLAIYAAVLFGAAAREPVSRKLLLAAAILDSAWVIASAAGLLAGWFPITLAGKWAIVGIADVVAILAALEFYALRRTRLT